MLLKVDTEGSHKISFAVHNVAKGRNMLKFVAHSVAESRYTVKLLLLLRIMFQRGDTIFNLLRTMLQKIETQ